MTGTAINIGRLPFTYQGVLATGELVNLWTIDENGLWTFHYAIDPTDASLANPTDQYVVCKKPIGGGVVVSVASGTNWEGV